MNQKQLEILAISAVSLITGYAIGRRVTYTNLKTDSELWIELEATSKLRRNAIRGVYKTLNDADRKIAVAEDYEFYRLINRGILMQALDKK